MAQCGAAKRTSLIGEYSSQLEAVKHATSADFVNRYDNGLMTAACHAAQDCVVRVIGSIPVERLRLLLRHPAATDVAWGGGDAYSSS